MATDETATTDGAAADDAAPAGDGETTGKTCFVVIGFGTKTDFATGRQLDLDKTYSKLIKPAFDEVGIKCFRAIDVNVAGSIDKLMYYWIYRADFVIADLSTMNANVFYELGVRHAQRPSTTMIMAENGIFEALPFDLSHTIIYGYDHLGDDIADAEVTRFRELITTQLRTLLSRDEPQDDSPVYTYLPTMTKPTWQDPGERIAELERRLAERDRFQARDDEPISTEALTDKSMSIIIDSAEAAKHNKDFGTAKTLFNTAIDNALADVADDAGERVRTAAVDVFLWQRLALVTYKEHEKAEDDGVAIAALREAEQILIDRCGALVSTDPETLGLSGAVNKRLYERTGEQRFLEASVGYYERGFYIKQDYYNGINAAYMYTIDAARLARQGHRFQAIVNYGHANIIRGKVATICRALIDGEAFDAREDREWIYMTLAEAYVGIGDDAAAEALMPKISELSKGPMDMSSFRDQNSKLVDAMETFERLVGTEDHTVASTSAAVDRDAADRPISVDLGALRGRPVRSVEVRVDFEP